MIKVEVDVDLSRISEKFKKNLPRAQKMLDLTIIDDCESHVPEDTGALKDSAYVASTIGTGRLVWLTPYARRWYYNVEGVTFRKGSGHWFEKAKDENIEEWRKLIRKYLSV